MQRDLKIGGYVVAQWPNAPLWVALAALLVRALVADETVDDVASAVFYLGITIWAYEEAANGVNGLRKVLGAVALVLIAVSLARALS